MAECDEALDSMYMYATVYARANDGWCACIHHANGAYRLSDAIFCHVNMSLLQTMMGRQ